MNLRTEVTIKTQQPNVTHHNINLCTSRLKLYNFIAASSDKKIDEIMKYAIYLDRR